MFSLSNVVCAFLPDQITDNYEGEIQLAEKMLYSGVSLAKLHPLSKTAAKTADTALGVFKSLVYAEKGFQSINSLKNLNEFNRADIVLKFSSIVLLPFSVISLIELVKPLDFVHSIFKEIPVFGLLKFGGITNFAVITLSCALISKSYQKEQDLQQQRANAGSSSVYEEIDLKIILNRIAMVESAAKISSSIFFLTVDILAYTHPSFTAVKVSFIAVEIICNTGKYIYTEALNQAA